MQTRDQRRPGCSQLPLIWGDPVPPDPPGWLVGRPPGPCGRMVIGLLTLDLHFPGARSLKDKRQALRSLETKIRNRHNVSRGRGRAPGPLAARRGWPWSAVNTDHAHLESTLAARGGGSGDRARHPAGGPPGGDPVSGRRTERLAEEIREEVARIIARGLKDPRIGFVTVTRVELTPDLRNAHVYVGVLGDRGGARARAWPRCSRRPASSAASWAGGSASATSPELDFHYDKGLDATDRVARLLAGGRRPARSRPTRRGRRRKGRVSRRGRRPRRGQAGRAHLARHRGPGAPRARHAAGRPHRHPRPLRDRRPPRLRRPGHAPRPLPGRGGEGVPGDGAPRVRHHHRRPRPASRSARPGAADARGGGARRGPRHPGGHFRPGAARLLGQARRRPAALRARPAGRGGRRGRPCR